MMTTKQTANDSILNAAKNILPEAVQKLGTADHAQALAGLLGFRCSLVVATGDVETVDAMFAKAFASVGQAYVSIVDADEAA